jgi:hypothetical protein
MTDYDFIDPDLPENSDENEDSQPVPGVPVGNPPSSDPYSETERVNTDKVAGEKSLFQTVVTKIKGVL